MLILFLYPVYVAKLSPPPQRAPQEIRKVTDITAQEVPEDKPSAQIKRVNAVDTVHDTVIENGRLWVKLSNQGARVNTIRLIRFKDVAGQDAVTICDYYSSDKGLFAGTGLFLGYDLNHTRFDYQEQKNRVDYRINLPGAFEIEKAFILEEDSNLLKVEIRIKNLQDKPLPVALDFISAGGMVKKEPFEERYLEIALSSPEKTQHDFLRQIRKTKEYISPVNWLALKNKYFCQVIAPQSDKISFSAERIENSNLETTAHLPLTMLSPRETREERFIFYAGPLDPELLARYNPDWQRIVFYGAFDGVAKLLLRILKGGFILLKNYGLAIILLSLLVNAVLFPFTWKGMRSMQRLQALQPEIEKLRQQYSSDPQKLNKEILEFYKKNKVNPFGGCLPMLLQMPVFISLYQALSRAIQLKGAHFLWIKDLSAPDAVLKFPAKVPFLGESLNLLPLIMVLATFLQQKKSQTVTPASQKQMALLMPLFLGLIFYNMPSGLILYWVTSTFLTLGLQSLPFTRQPHTHVT